MKKVFTLIAGMLLISSGAFAQEKWQNIAVKGDMEGTLPAYATLDEMSADGAEWNSFWVHEFPKNEEGEEQFQGTATIIEDPVLAGNHCARVVARSEAIADSCGNKTDNNGALASWDCQFFIYATEPIPEGKLVKMTLKVRADKAGSFETQAHFEPGNYNHYVMFGNVNVTTEWTTVEVETTVTADQTGNANGKEFQSVAFNLSTDKEGNVFYFDDVKLEIKDDKPLDPEGGWVNFIRKGTLSEDKFGDFTTFTGRNGATNKDEKAQIVNDSKDGQPALTVETVAWNTYVALKDSLGNDSIDDDGNIVYNKYLIVDGDTILSSVSTDNKSFDDWRTQFFVTVNHKFVGKDTFKFRMWARAERVDGQALEEGISLDTQIHTMPGNYIHWSFVGSINDINEEWQEFVFGTDDEPMTMPSDGANKGGQTVAFNCNKNKDVAVKLFFRFDELSFNEGLVKDEERVLASSDATISVGTNQDGIGEGKLDMTEALKVLEIDNFDNYIDNTKMKVQAWDAENEEVKYEDVDLTAGANINADGFWQESDANAIILELDEDNTGDGILAFVTTNNGVAIDAKGIATKFAFEKDGWRYLFNVNIVDPETYEKYLGISEMNVAPKANAIYDMMGRQLTKPGKGLYIMNGKKVLVK